MLPTFVYNFQIFKVFSSIYFIYMSIDEVHCPIL